MAFSVHRIWRRAAGLNTLVKIKAAWFWCLVATLA
jgi:hypothetical protein